MTSTERPRPPITIKLAGPGRVVIRGCPRSALALLALDRQWSADLGGWVMAEVAADVVAGWARDVGRGGTRPGGAPVTAGDAEKGVRRLLELLEEVDLTLTAGGTRGARCALLDGLAGDEDVKRFLDRMYAHGLVLAALTTADYQPFEDPGDDALLLLAERLRRVLRVDRELVDMDAWQGGAA